MKKQVLYILFTSFIFTINAQNQKKLWAKSFLNEKAPELIVEDWITDKPHTEGKYVLIDFWATWCAPCKKAIPELNHFAKKFKDKLVVIGISDETKKKITKLKTPKIDYYSAYDTRKKLKNIYKVKGIPHVVVINPKGIVVWEGYPLLKGHELTEEVMTDLLNDK